jgi:hypothetical protein
MATQATGTVRRADQDEDYTRFGVTRGVPRSAKTAGGRILRPATSNGGISKCWCPRSR